ncbi:MAG: TonB-dependent receptor, partial [Vicinamibacterales bacterium]
MRSGSTSLVARWGRFFRPQAPALGTFLLRFTLGLTATVALAATAAPAQAASLTGRVIDPDGQAVARARVIVATPIGPVAETVAGAGGDFQFPDLSDGRYDVLVFADGFQAPPTTVEVAGPLAREVTIALRVSALTESIVVSASQVEAARSALPSSVTVISGAELRARQVESVADALRQVSGLTVTRSGGRGAITSLFPRGGASNYTLVLVDGIRANSFGGGYDFAHLSIANVERIEIVRGPQSALYGSEAIGAVVQIVTRRGGAPRVDGLVEAGTQGTARTTVGAQGGGGPWAWGVGLERAASDGATSSTAAAGERVANDDYSRWLTTGTLSYRKAGGLDATAAATISGDERGFPGPWGRDPISAFPGIDLVSRGVNDTRRIGIQVEHPWRPAVRQRIEASYADLGGRFTSAFGESTSGTRRFDGRIQEDVALSSRAAVSGGIELVREEGRSTFVTGERGQAIPVDRQVLGTFGEARLTPTPRLQITGGLRVERLTRRAVEADPLAFTPRPAFPAQTVTSVNPKVAASWLITPAGAPATTRLRASAGTGIRPPDVFEIAFTDNPGLKPERSRSVELGLEQQWRGGAVAVDAAVFANRYDDLIVTVGRSLAAASRYRTDNISNARARGLELTARSRLAGGFAAA